MALVAKFQGYTVESDQAAHKVFFFTSKSDLPDIGTTVSWVVDQAGTALYGGTVVWAVSNVKVNQLYPWGECEIEARRAGLDWTWVGLPPIESLGKYQLVFTDTRWDSGICYQGFWTQYSNWSHTDDWAFGDPPTITTLNPIWILEFLDTSNHQTWLGHRNGTWPGGFNPPAGTGAGIYLCYKMDVEFERHYLASTGASTIYYRHYASFRQAPFLPTPAAYGVWAAPAW